MAFTTYTALIWTAMDFYNPAHKAKEIASKLSTEMLTMARKSRKFALHNAALVALTVASGAFVAGNDAGNAFNTWPKMGDHWIPEGITELTPFWKNLFENTATVQFDHRMLAYSTLSAIGLMFWKAKTAMNGQFWANLPAPSRFAYRAVAAMSVAQVGLGISTLLMYVPIPLAATHQFGSLTLLTLITALAHSLNFSKAAPAAAASATSKVATSLFLPRQALMTQAKSFHVLTRQVKTK
jgi:cytochrome c oxidase assembly protein subunit 15